jgi:hypothetical protein
MERISPTYDIFEKIKNWTVKREDVSLLFGEKTGEAMYLSIGFLNYFCWRKNGLP